MMMNLTKIKLHFNEKLTDILKGTSSEFDLRIKNKPAINIFSS